MHDYVTQPMKLGLPRLGDYTEPFERKGGDRWNGITDVF